MAPGNNRTEQESYAERLGTLGFWHFYPLPVMRMCSEGPFYRVLVVLDDGEDHWTWHDYRDDRFCFTHPKRYGVEMCFPYGPQIEEERGRGKLKRCRVDVLGKVDAEGKELPL